MNNGKYHTLEYKQKQEAKVDRLFGPITDHTKKCQCCSKDFLFTGRLKTKQYENAKFCSRSCANNRTTWWKDNATHYRTIAFHNHKKECVVCVDLIRLLLFITLMRIRKTIICLI
jgi:hypothetical protein